jgi:hypothetical protein
MLHAWGEEKFGTVLVGKHEGKISFEELGLDRRMLLK